MLESLLLHGNLAQMLVEWQALGLLLTQIHSFGGYVLDFLLHNCLSISMTNTLFLKGSLLSENSGDSVSCGERLCTYVYESFSYVEAPFLVMKHKVINLSGSKKQKNVGT